MPQCPACKIESDAIYIGALHVECINPHCRHYSDKARKLYDESQRHPAEKPQEEFKFEDEDTNPHWPFVLD